MAARKWRRVFGGESELFDTGGRPHNVQYEFFIDADRIDLYVARATRNKNRVAKAGPFIVRAR